MKVQLKEFEDFFFLLVFLLGVLPVFHSILFAVLANNGINLPHKMLKRYWCQKARITAKFS